MPRVSQRSAATTTSPSVWLVCTENGVIREKVPHTALGPLAFPALLS